jgi:hypothetical protein
MIPTHMLHQIERTRIRAEQREADIRTSELAAAFGQLGCSLARPFRALRRLAQHGLGRLAIERTMPAASDDQLVEGAGLAAAD